MTIKEKINHLGYALLDIADMASKATQSEESALYALYGIQERTDEAFENFLSLDNDIMKGEK